jgi:hypothetical protein
LEVNPRAPPPSIALPFLGPTTRNARQPPMTRPPATVPFRFPSLSPLSLFKVEPELSLSPFALASCLHALEHHIHPAPPPLSPSPLEELAASEGSLSSSLFPLG